MQGTESENEARTVTGPSERRFRFSVVQANLPSAFGLHCVPWLSPEPRKPMQTERSRFDSIEKRAASRPFPNKFGHGLNLHRLCRGITSLRRSQIARYGTLPSFRLSLPESTLPVPGVPNRKPARRTRLADPPQAMPTSGPKLPRPRQRDCLPLSRNGPSLSPFRTRL